MAVIPESTTPLHTSTPLLVLQAGALRAVLAPDAGGSIASFSSIQLDGGRRRELHWLRPATGEALARANPLGMGSFPLVPFCNRIRDGRASFEGREIRFPPNHPEADAPHPLHGIGWLQPWQVRSAGPDRAELVLDVPASAAWPWHFSATQEVVVAPDALAVTMRITNLDSAAMPAGIGHHPYFAHTPGTRLTVPVEAMWQADAEVMPTSLERGGVAARLSAGVELAELDLDNNFTGWDRWARIDWPADRHGPARSLLIEAEAPLDHFVVYCPAGFDSFCAEPVSQCTDWLNLLPRHGAGPLGGARVEPGATLEARFRLRPT